MTVPEGYHCTFDENWFRPWICDRCGASVVASAFSTHDAWHAELRSMPETIIGRIHAARLAEIKRTRA